MDTKKNDFYGLGIAPSLLEGLSSFGFKVPTPIQHKAIPILLEGKDLIGIAQTGTGKTLAFGIPMIQRLAKMNGRGLVLVPTRELAIQVNEAVSKLAQLLKMGTSVLIGGESISLQVASLRRNPRIIVATPGRLIDHVGQHHIRLDDVHTLVLDEADRMLDMGFAPQIDRILGLIPKEWRQTMLFSATMPTEILKIATRHMNLPVRTEIAPSGTVAEKVTQEIFVVRRDLKSALLKKLLEQYKGSVLLFARTRYDARRVTQFLRKVGQSVAEIHSDRTLSQRKEAMSGFKSGRYRVLVATDIASRGIDVKEIELVINYDLPDETENYVHRIGRTGRAGHPGHAITFAMPDQERDVRAIERLIKTSLALSAHPEVPTERFAAEKSYRPQPSHGPRRFFRGSRR